MFALMLDTNAYDDGRGPSSQPISHDLLVPPPLFIGINRLAIDSRLLIVECERTCRAR